LNNNFNIILRRIIYLSVDVERYANRFGGGKRHSGRKGVLIYYFSVRIVDRSSQGSEDNLPGLPTKTVCQHAGPCVESSDIRRNIKGLNLTLGVHRCRITPTAYLDIHLTIILIAAGVVPGIHRKN